MITRSKQTLRTNLVRGSAQQHEKEATVSRDTTLVARLVHRRLDESSTCHMEWSSAFQTDLDEIFVTIENIHPCGSVNRHSLWCFYSQNHLATSTWWEVISQVSRTTSTRCEVISPTQSEVISKGSRTTSTQCEVINPTQSEVISPAMKSPVK